MIAWKKSLSAPPTKMATANVKSSEELLIWFVFLEDYFLDARRISYCRACLDDGLPFLSFALSLFFLRPDEDSSIFISVYPGIHLALLQSVFQMVRAPDTVFRYPPAVVDITTPSSQRGENILRRALAQSHPVSLLSPPLPPSASVLKL